MRRGERIIVVNGAIEKIRYMNSSEEQAAIGRIDMDLEVKTSDGGIRRVRFETLPFSYLKEGNEVTLYYKSKGILKKRKSYSG